MEKIVAQQSIFEWVTAGKGNTKLENQLLNNYISIDVSLESFLKKGSCEPIKRPTNLLMVYQ